MKKKVVIIIKYSVMIAIVMLFLLPIIYMLANSFMPSSEIIEAYSPEQGEYAEFKVIPEKFSLEQYYNVFLRRPTFLKMFWNSLAITVPIVVFQSLISIFAAFAFAKLKFPGRDKLFFVYIVLLLLPLQVTLVPNYIVINDLGLMDTLAAIILPSSFSAFGVCLLRQYMRYVPDETIEAAHVDGASYIKILFRIVIPQVKGGMAALIILTFIDCWNMVEQIIVYLEDSSKYPLSVTMRYFSESDPGVIFACGVIFAVPPLLLYLYHSKEFKDAKV